MSWIGCAASLHILDWKCALLTYWTRAPSVWDNFSGSTLPLRNSIHCSSLTYLITVFGAYILHTNSSTDVDSFTFRHPNHEMSHPRDQDISDMLSRKASLHNRWTIVQGDEFRRLCSTRLHLYFLSLHCLSREMESIIQGHLCHNTKLSVVRNLVHASIQCNTILCYLLLCG